MTVETGMSNASIKAGNKTFVLQFNKMLKDYQYLTDKFFKIRLKAWEVPGTEIKNDKNGKIEKTDDFTNIFNCDLLYSGQSFSVNHSHQWGANNRGFLASLLGGIGGAKGFNLSALKDMSKADQDLSNLWDSLKSKATGDEGVLEINDKLAETINRNIRNPIFSTVDLSNSYEGSSPLTFTVTATVIAYDDPIRDVVLPCKILEYMSYPKLNTSSGLTKLLSEYGYTIGAEKSPGYDPARWQKVRDGIYKAAFTDGESNTFSGTDSTALSFRTREGKPPPVWQVSFSNGLHSLNNCALTNVGVNYYGPWLAKPRKIEESNGTLLQSAMEGLAAGAGAMGWPMVATAMGFASNALTPEEITTNAESSGRGGYPSYAEITLTFTDNFNFPHGEDVLKSILGGVEDVIHVR